MTAQEPMSTLTGSQRIGIERQRQIAEEGHTLTHDNEHDDGTLAWAAAVYAAPERFYQVERGERGVSWSEPWPDGWRRNGAWAGDRKLHGSTESRIRELEKAGALIAAEIDRLIAGDAR